MDIIYKGFWSICPKRSRKEIEIEKRGASEFPLFLENCHKAWGIWLKLSDKMLLVNPITLVNTLYIDGEQYDFFESLENDDSDKYLLWTERKDYSVEVTLENLQLENKSVHIIMFEEYVDKIQSCCLGLAEKVREGCSIAYDEREIPKDSILACAAQVELQATLPSYYFVRTSDVMIEPFVFNPQRHDEKYEIGLGNRRYKTFLTHWDSDMEAIRHELESIVYETETVVRLSFDMTETLVKMKKVKVLDKVNRSDDGTGYQYKDYMLVEIHPNDFVQMPILTGYCDIKEMIRSFYEGLLQMAIRHPEKGSEIDVPFRMVAYNKYKSPLIESYLKNQYVGNEKCAIRQVHVEHILTIDPDHEQLFINEKGISLVDEKIIGVDGNVVNLDKLIAWQKEMESIVVVLGTGTDYNIDWADYHQRGMALAHQLRAELPPSYDIWYKKPWEDKSDFTKRPILII